MAHSIATTKEILVEELAKLFRDNIWKLYRLLESVILDRGPQVVVELTKKLNRILGIEIKLLIAFYLQIDGQTKCMNQELEQYL